MLFSEWPEAVTVGDVPKVMVAPTPSWPALPPNQIVSVTVIGAAIAAPPITAKAATAAAVIEFFITISPFQS
ncbi:hypothetical protein GCM10017056_22340 [Seohaeicola zhoushanensis]|uniref:Uncharacterized protein n=1 Tax=Seohaeicola zhoushanensis TaxID=1569283 RepID=A0A8J3GXZ0_9RHOB|nr:hypothetical protein GCM10017056_22340 [Seohaeicola zhoushanensis]